MFNVLNQNGKKIKVEAIDVKLHRHVSGREFTKDDKVKFIEEKKVVESKPKTPTKQLKKKK